jgi:hypothetical protein
MSFTPRIYSKSRRAIVGNYLNLIKERNADALAAIDNSLTPIAPANVRRSAGGLLSQTFPMFLVTRVRTEIEENEDGSLLKVKHFLEAMLKLVGPGSTVEAAEELETVADKYLEAMDALTRSFTRQELLAGLTKCGSLYWDVTDHDNDTTRRAKGDVTTFVQLPTFNVEFHLLEG